MILEVILAPFFFQSVICMIYGWLDVGIEVVSFHDETITSYGTLLKIDAAPL